MAALQLGSQRPCNLQLGDFDNTGKQGSCPGDGTTHYTATWTGAARSQKLLKEYP
jgi:hypothetical protein